MHPPQPPAIDLGEPGRPEPPAEVRSEPSHAEMLLIALFAAPLAGWATMVLCWLLVVETENRGGPDLGVLLAGSVTAATFTLAYGALKRASVPKLIVWPLAAFLLTFAVSAAIVIPMSWGTGPGFD